LPVLAGRRRAVVIAPIAMILILSMAVPVTAAADPPGLARFMNAIARVESGGRYTARNPVSGAFGRYQIMPPSWQAWASQFLGSADAPRTAANQERVARAKMASLYRWLGTWRRVAYWWLTGSSQTSSWSSSATAYVARVMRHYDVGSDGGSSKPAPIKRFPDASASIGYAGPWASAGYGGYVGGTVRYSGQAGASATFTFSGDRIQWYGPIGPTRGQARVSIDGVVVKVVNLHASSFHARSLVFAKDWAGVGTHTLKVEVIGTRGHPLVAIDELIVGR